MTYLYWQNFKKLVLDILFPPICLSCEKILENYNENYICENCRDRVVINDTLFCVECLARLPKNSKTCHLKTLARLAAATKYDEPVIKKLIQLLKYKKIKAALKSLEVILIKYILNLDYDFSEYKIIPLPLHPKRLRERGFNQAKLVANLVSQKLNIRIINDVLLKFKNTKPQAEIKTREERAKNILNCFTINASLVPAIVNQKILLVDDIFTSGATTLEAARVLKTAGTKDIIIFTIAKGR